jgi:uncharacterized membrane protein
MKTHVIKVLRWLSIVASLIFSIDAMLTLYKTVAFQGGIESPSDFSTTLIICSALLVITVLTGLGALAGELGRTILLPARAILSIAIGLASIFLFMNAFPHSEWIELVLTSKSESVGLCLILSVMLIGLTWNTKQ